jgi:hypothetical protein
MTSPVTVEELTSMVTRQALATWKLVEVTSC